MNKNSALKAQISEIIENGYAETHVGYHAEYRYWHGDFCRGCYVQIAYPYCDAIRIYADSYFGLLKIIEQL